MSDLLRAEIKSWERDFASVHGRDPSVQDIRDQPSIAEKYKLYKKLSKAAAAAPASQTPPRSHSRLPARKSRPTESIQPLPGFNPFSPVKKSAKRNHTPQASPSRHANPFATPAKNKPNPCPRTATPSPDPFSSIRPHANASSGQPVSTTAVSRARKRLRGEPVSPSPNKPKRQRIRSQAAPPIPKLDRDSSNSERETDQELPHCDFTSSFVADSPVKAPAGGKSFKLLFDDALPVPSLPKKPLSLFLAQQRASASHSVPTVLKPHRDLNSKGVTSRPEHRLNRIQGKLSAQIFPAKDNIPAPSHKPTLKSVASQLPQPTTSMKRALDAGDLVPSQSLIPPSPPPQDTISRNTGKGKARITTGRKKLRVEADESDGGVDSPDEITFKVAATRLDRSKDRHADNLEWDPLLHFGTRNHDTTAIDANHHASGTLTVDLPDKFRRVLAISPVQRQNSTEERVVRGLLYGDRVGHFHPTRGGDIWDAGETDEGALGDAETEDDWEGEPVPWEVGEL
ncbi:hypothetical protein JVT61DRAFT_5412 [Boletus reticuloceps]|uniref:DNA replication regulator SLD2 n=1 Tax=Boletus reticuloceps TaxID=495285 RepID=A0A8I2Z1J8_9AGAM|nr:hypothetical protein JVT61DRAFT_5412 [Boletus reticuloceps]